MLGTEHSVPPPKLSCDLYAPICPLPRFGGFPITLQRLKIATRERHAAIESRSVLLDPQLSLSTYRESLARFFGYYAPLELSLRSALSRLETGFAYGERYKCPQLREDLVVLGFAPHALSDIPQCQALPDLSTPAKLLGCLYVVEGSTLGGQIITRHLRNSLGVTPQSGGSFFSGYGEHTGSRWKECCAHLTIFASRSTHEEENAQDSDHEIIVSANATFESFDRWLYPTKAKKTTPYEPAEHT